MPENSNTIEEFGLELLVFRSRLRRDGLERCFDDLDKQWPRWQSLARTSETGERMLAGIRTAVRESYQAVLKRKGKGVRLRLEKLWQTLPAEFRGNEPSESQEAAPVAQTTTEAGLVQTPGGDKPQVHPPETLPEDWSDKISDRAYHIVSIANGVFCLHISHEAILEGEISGQFASISGGTGFVSAGARNSMRQEQRLELIQVCQRDGFMLKLETGMSAEECRLAYESSNFLVWHELAHLVNSKIVSDCVLEMRLDPILGDNLAIQLNEIVIDAIAMRLGMKIYVHHTDRRQRLVVDQNERRAIMVDSHLAAVGRILDFNLRKKVDEYLLLRLLAELFTHRALFNDIRLEEAITAAKKALPRGFSDRPKMIAGIFARLYHKALALNPLELPFEKS